MATALPLNFQIPGETAIASYSYTDIASATGYVKYYLAASQDSTGYTYKLKEDPDRGASGNLAGSTASATYVEISDIDYDILFNRPVRIRGLASITIPAASNRSAGTAVTKVTINLYHYDGSTETLIATIDSHEAINSAGMSHFSFICDLNISSIVTFKAGEIFRVNIKFYGKSSSGTDNFIYYIDPTDTPTTWNGGDVTYTASYIKVPFVIDL